MTTTNALTASANAGQLAGSAPQVFAALSKIAREDSKFFDSKVYGPLVNSPWGRPTGKPNPASTARAAI